MVETFDDPDEMRRSGPPDLQYEVSVVCRKCGQEIYHDTTADMNKVFAGFMPYAHECHDAPKPA